MTLLRSLAVLVVFTLAPARGQTVPAGNAAAPGIPAAVGEGPGPWHDPADLTRWPNRTSRANGDRWLVENHDRLRHMRPRVLVVLATERAAAVWPRGRLPARK